MMNQIKCPAGHYYDPQKHTTCPYCGVRNLDLGVTRPIKNAAKKGKMTTCPQGHYYDEEKYSSCPNCQVGAGDVGLTRSRTEVSGTDKKAGLPDEEKTRAFFENQLGINPVVGWLVCIEGDGRGKDYSLRGEKNSIGRSEKMDICLSGDRRISRENHAFIVYNPGKNIFRLHPGESRSLVYLNDEEVITPTELKHCDIISIGDSKLLFVPLCGDSFRWT